MDWATEILAAVIRKAGENPDAPFTTEALQAAAIVEEQELTTFLRYRRNLKERHVSITVLDEGLRRLETRQRGSDASPSGGGKLRWPPPRPRAGAQAARTPAVADCGGWREVVG